MVSYWRNPGGHCGSSLSSSATTAAAEEPIEESAPSSSRPPSKKDPEKSNVWERTENERVGRSPVLVKGRSNRWAEMKERKEEEEERIDEEGELARVVAKYAIVRFLKKDEKDQRPGVMEWMDKERHILYCSAG